jgi:hypothetical protein
MNSPLTWALGVFFGGVAFIQGVDVLAPGDRMFMTVHSVEVSDGIVAADRTVDYFAVADWRVTVVAEENGEPHCQTVPGPELDAGWSTYQPGRIKRTMPLDVWVGQDGCLASLTPGEYHQFVTWTPRDDTRPVAWHSTFTVSAPSN